MENVNGNLEKVSQFSNTLGLYGLLLAIVMFVGYRFIKSKAYERMIGLYLKKMRVNEKNELESLVAIGIPLLAVMLLVLFGLAGIVDLLLQN
ncbi:hypothetical protein [Paenibacillus sp. 1A_MP2]|uniref:hypothetical protein n=1 Tax=Paenibacillus sp. 1A_MP2 TaxID=3457495 RepID=UPI003FCCA89E